MITTFGEIMLRISPVSSGERIAQAGTFRIEPGGSESNVAIALSNLGMETAFVTCLPNNELALKIVQQLNKFSVSTSNIVTKGDRLGVYWTETGSGPRNSFVIYDREHSAFSESNFMDYHWAEIFSNISWFHFSGISPAVSFSVAELLQKVVDFCPCPYSVDLNFREKLWSWLNKDKEKINKVMTGLCSKATLIAGNETDFQDIFGLSLKGYDKDSLFAAIAERSFLLFPATRYIAISSRESVSATINNWSGYLFVKGDEQFAYKGMDYCLDSIYDRVGTGDSFVAGIIFGLAKAGHFSHQQTVDFAVTLSALNHTTIGDVSNFNESDVLRTMHNKGSGRIVR